MINRMLTDKRLRQMEKINHALYLTKHIEKNNPVVLIDHLIKIVPEDYKNDNYVVGLVLFAEMALYIPLERMKELWWEPMSIYLLENLLGNLNEDWKLQIMSSFKESFKTFL